MADKSITQLTQVTALTGSDVVPVVNNSETKKVSISDLFASAPLLTVAGLIKVAGQTETKSSGAVSVDRTVSFVTNGTASPVNIALPDGSANMIKIIIADSLTSQVNITSANGNGFSSIPLATSGASVILFFSTKWHILGKS